MKYQDGLKKLLERAGFSAEHISRKLVEIASRPQDNSEFAKKRDDAYQNYLDSEKKGSVLPDDGRDWMDDDKFENPDIYTVSKKLADLDDLKVALIIKIFEDKGYDANTPHQQIKDAYVELQDKIYEFLNSFTL